MENNNIGASGAVELADGIRRNGTEGSITAVRYRDYFSYLLVDIYLSTLVIVS